MAATRKRYRSKTNRQLAGECGGLAEHFNLDATP
jgi:phage shock protein PspC (stress-responsive transcriptional regulator)